MYDGGIGPRGSHTPRFDSPNDTSADCSFGALRQGRRFLTHLPGGFAEGGVMVRANWSQVASRKRMRRQGLEDIDGRVPLFAQPPKKPRRKLSKAELRQQAEAALLAWRAGQTSKDK